MALSQVNITKAIVETIPEREAIIFRDRRYTYGEYGERCARLANYLLSHGITIREERDGIPNWESGQDHVALYLYNGNEYLEGMVGAMAARAVPLNINYRYVAEELLYVLKDSKTKALVFHANFAPLVAEVAPQLPDLKVMLQVADESGNDLVEGAVDYEEALASASPDFPDVESKADDLFIIYTGGTTGMPKGVLWRQEDIVSVAFTPETKDKRKAENTDEIKEKVANGRSAAMLPLPPFMHGTGLFTAFSALNNGHRVVIQDSVQHLDPGPVMDLIAKEKVTALTVVGDAFCRPIAAAMNETSADLSTLKAVVNSGAAISPDIQSRMFDAAPHMKIMNRLGSSESGPQAEMVLKPGEDKPRFYLQKNAAVISEDYDAVLEPEHDGMGWLATRGRVPLGYLGDEAKTKKTFPELDGVRYSVPGDRVKLLADNELEFHGRDSVTINSGGEKIFAEEVENALLHHPHVVDAVVSSRPSERWGSEVVAVLSLSDGVEANDATEASLLEECGKHIARYKFPKAFKFVDVVKRAPNGKADYRWAKELAEG